MKSDKDNKKKKKHIQKFFFAKRFGLFYFISFNREALAIQGNP